MLSSGKCVERCVESGSVGAEAGSVRGKGARQELVSKLVCDESVDWVALQADAVLDAAAYRGGVLPTLLAPRRRQPRPRRALRWPRLSSEPYSACPVARTAPGQPEVSLAPVHGVWASDAPSARAERELDSRVHLPLADPRVNRRGRHRTPVLPARGERRRSRDGR